MKWWGDGLEQLLGNEAIRKELERRAGVARPGAKDYLMDFLSVTPKKNTRNIIEGGKKWNQEER